MSAECHRVIDLLYESTSGYSREADKTNASNAVRDLFKTLLQIRVHSSDSKSRLGEVPRRRIVYLRDFGSISHGATPIMCALLQAIHDLSSSKHDTDAVPSTVILVLGVSRNIGMKGKPSKSEDKGCFKWLSWTQEATIGGLVDPADSVPPVPVGASAREPYPPHFHGFRVEEEYVMPVGGFSKYAGPLLSLLVMPLIHSRIGQVDIQPFITLDTNLEQHVESMSSDGPTLVCYPENTHLNEFRTAQQLEIIKRTDAINNLMLKVSVGKKGGSPVQGLSLSADMTGVYDTQYVIYQALRMFYPTLISSSDQRQESSRSFSTRLLLISSPQLPLVSPTSKTPSRAPQSSFTHPIFFPRINHLCTAR